MKVSVFGLGYVGCVTAACLARGGHQLVGVDVNPVKVSLVNSGRAPLTEPGLEDLMFDMVQKGRLSATGDDRYAVMNSDITLICVGTPSAHNGYINLQYMESVCTQIGKILAEKLTYHVVVVRSTVLPETVEKKLIPIIEENSGKTAGRDFGVCMNPEFLREGSAIEDFDHPGTIVIGEVDARSGQVVEQLYQGIDGEVIHTELRCAEMIKYACNAYHAVKIVFANEIGRLCKNHGIDGQEVMGILCKDRRLNISPVYLKPGFAFGGSCLPKDLRALSYRAKERDETVPLLNSLMLSNQLQIDRAVEMVELSGKHKIGILGLSFKQSTDDVRESPTIKLVETLVGRGYEVEIFDEFVDPEKLFGANRAFLERQLPHIAMHMRKTIDEVVSESELVVLATGSGCYCQAATKMRVDQIMIDLVGKMKGEERLRCKYEGIGW